MIIQTIYFNINTSSLPYLLHSNPSHPSPIKPKQILLIIGSNGTLIFLSHAIACLISLSRSVCNKFTKTMSQCQYVLILQYRHSQVSELPAQLKSSPLDSLVSRLARCVCDLLFQWVNHSTLWMRGGEVAERLLIRRVQHLWKEFCAEMRFRWENDFLIPGCASFPSII